MTYPAGSRRNAGRAGPAQAGTPHGAQQQWRYLFRTRFYNQRVKPSRLLLILALAVAAFAQAPSAPPSFRLGNAVVPLRQTVDITIVPAEDEFSGATDIDLNVREPQSVLWLNATDLKIQSATLRLGGQVFDARPIAGGEDFAGFALDRPVPVGKAALHIAYRGAINARSSSGIFKNKVGGSWYAFTQFESIDARRAFPCFDEPSFKIPWQVTLHVPREQMALSNTPALAETDEPRGMKLVRFEETRPLPSYLVAFAVGPFEAVNAGARRVPLRIITPRGMAAQAKYAAEVTPQLLDVLESYFGVPFPYPKLDSLAVPLFFGAMENPGLITYSQGLILNAPAKDTLGRQREYASVAAHEMAHSWFGDLVTTAWWDDIWLNEAFATWMASRTLERWQPGWREELSEAKTRNDAMRSDSLLSARRIRQPVNSKDDIANAFDAITYDKGAAVIGMFEQWISPEVFRRGVQRYLEQHADGNATAADFLSAVSAAAGRDIGPAFSTFLDQPGVPLVAAALQCAAGQPPALDLSQKRYLPLGSAPPSGQLWQIPVCSRFEGGGQPDCTLLRTTAAPVRIPAAESCPAWLLLNAGDAGYYRTLYRGGMLERVLADGGKRLSPVERIGVLGDVKALVRGGDLPAEEALRIVPEFANDPTRQVIGATIGIVEGMGDTLVPRDLRPNYQRFVRKIYGPRARDLGWLPQPGESDDLRLLRPELVSFVADQGDDPVLVEQAAKLARQWLDDHNALPAEVVEPVLDTAARHGSRPLYGRLAAELGKTGDSQVREQILGAMASFRDPAIVKENFNLLLGGEIDPREGMGLLYGPLADVETRAIPFALVRANYGQLVARLPRTVDSDMSAELPTLGSRFCDEQSRGELAAFFKDRADKTAGGPRILAQTIEAIDQCIAIRKVQQPGVADFLRNY
jgi:alanyl aminopeptidase